ncbi:GntR family transcriptional regulator [Bradyrhizobium sp. USDA 4469]
MLEGFAGRECARLHDPDAACRIRDALTRLKAAAARQDLVDCLEAKSAFYAAMIGGCRNAFIERMLKPLHDRIQLLRMTSISQPKRINKSLREFTAIWRAIQNGDAHLAERCCVEHINAAAVAALDMIENSSATKDAAASNE